jgi:hypothetical protein
LIAVSRLGVRSDFRPDANQLYSGRLPAAPVWASRDLGSIRRKPWKLGIIGTGKVRCTIERARTLVETRTFSKKFENLQSGGCPAFAHYTVLRYRR